MISQMNTRTMKGCPRCDKWHTLVGGFWRHVNPVVACKYTEAAKPASMDATDAWNAISQVLDSRECQHCGEPYAEILLDDTGNCPACHWSEEPNR